MAKDMEQQVNAIFPPRGRSIVGTASIMCPAEYVNSGMYESLCRHPNAWQTEETYEGVMTITHSPRGAQLRTMTVRTGTIARPSSAM